MFVSSSRPGFQVWNELCVLFDLSVAFADPELLGVGSLLKKYIALLCTHIGDILPVATSIASTGRRHFAEVSRVIEGDLTGNPSLDVLFVCCMNCMHTFKELEKVTDGHMDSMESYCFFFDRGAAA